MIDELITKYIELRDKKTAIKVEMDARMTPIDTAMSKIENYLMAQMVTMGTESMKTSAGTAYRTSRSKVSVADWDSFLGYVKEHSLWHMLNRSANKTAVDEFKEANQDLPPGVNYVTELVVNVRR